MIDVSGVTTTVEKTEKKQRWRTDDDEDEDEDEGKAEAKAEAEIIIPVYELEDEEAWSFTLQHPSEYSKWIMDRILHHPDVLRISRVRHLTMEEIGVHLASRYLTMEDARLDPKTHQLTMRSPEQMWFVAGRRRLVERIKAGGDSPHLSRALRRVLDDDDDEAGTDHDASLRDEAKSFMYHYCRELMAWQRAKALSQVLLHADSGTKLRSQFPGTSEIRKVFLADVARGCITPMADEADPVGSSAPTEPDSLLLVEVHKAQADFYERAFPSNFPITTWIREAATAAGDASLLNRAVMGEVLAAVGAILPDGGRDGVARFDSQAGGGAAVVKARIKEVLPPRLAIERRRRLPKKS